MKPTYKIILNIDGINNLYKDNELIDNPGLRYLKISGSGANKNLNPYKFNTLTNNNCNICYVIHCYINGDNFNNFKALRYEIINIIQQYKDVNIRLLKTEIKQYLIEVVKYCKTLENKECLKNRYNIEILYTQHNGGIFNV